MQRHYERLLAKHLRELRQMAWVVGPRQAGKTTACKQAAPFGVYLNWDNLDHRRLILKGPAAIAEYAGLTKLQDATRATILIFDEIHKYARWKTLLKGFFDTYAVRVLVTGSTRLDVYRRGGDSLMGRYFLYRLHPLTIAEITRYERPEEHLLMPPAPIANEDFAALWTHGGFPEPYITRDTSFTTRWHALRRQQLVREDVRDLTRVAEVDRLEALVDILSERSGQQTTLSSLANDVQVSVDTIRRWLPLLESLYQCFLLRPWQKGVANSLRKEPKVYAWDWSHIADDGQRAETMVACHLLKAVHYWTDTGHGKFELHYVRDKQKREADFIVVRDRKPWFLVEVKLSDTRLSPVLTHFHQALRTQHAFQVVINMDYVDGDCFTRSDAVVVPARTFLAQLV